MKPATPLLRPGCTASAILKNENLIILIQPGAVWDNRKEVEVMDVIDLDNLALEIAQKHLLKNLSFKELGRMYYAAPSTIHRRLMKWLEEDRFELRDKLGERKAAYIISREDDLGESLVKKTGIWRARVVSVAGVEQAFTRQYLDKADSQDAQAAYRASDELHRCLGEAAAELIFNSLRKNLTIGLSSGRGVGFAVEKLAEIVHRTPSWASGYESIHLVSLCGGAHIGMWEFSNSRDFDADENVFALAALLKVPRENVFYISGPISMDPLGRRLETSPAYNLDLAVLGLGQLNTQHHYFRDRNELQLKAMSGPIRRLIEWQAQNPDLLDSVAEIILRLYPVGGKPLSPEFLETLRETNKTILAIDPGKVKNAGEIMLIAGGRQKLNALYGVLSGQCPEAPIDKRNLTLVTDAWTAEAILQRISAKPGTLRAAKKKSEPGAD
jgi:DNA-binding transcriptional regulator LsrR (DeoR family)